MIASLLLGLGCTGSGTLGVTDDTASTATTDSNPVPTDTDTDVEGIGGVDEPELVLYSYDEIAQFELVIPGDSWQQLTEQTMTEQWYVEADLVYDGQVWESIGVRTKSENSWRPITDKSSLKLKFRS